MYKLTATTKYTVDKDSGATIYARLKATGKFVAAFRCHVSCIAVIKAAGRLDADNVVLRPILR